MAVARNLFKLKRFHYSLFFCHLALEKIIKGLVFKKTHKHPLPIHNLVKLVQQAKIDFNQQRTKELEEITTWNIQARYDSVKRDFYKKATKEFTQKWLERVEGLFRWFQKQY